LINRYRARRAGKGQDEAIVEYRRLNPCAIGDKLPLSGEINRMIAAAINAEPEVVLARAGCTMPSPAEACQVVATVIGDDPMATSEMQFLRGDPADSSPGQPIRGCVSL